MTAIVVTVAILAVVAVVFWALSDLGRDGFEKRREDRRFRASVEAALAKTELTLTRAGKVVAVLVLAEYSFDSHAGAQATFVSKSQFMADRSVVRWIS